MSSFTCDPPTISAPHQPYSGNPSSYQVGAIWMLLKGTGTSWSGGTTFTVSGVAGVYKASQNVLSTTSAVIELYVGSATGTLVVSDGTTNTNLPIGAPSISVAAPSFLPLNSTTNVYLIGTNTVWSSESGGSGRWNFSIGNVADCSLTLPAFHDTSSTSPYSADRAAVLEITTGSTPGELRITDNPSGAFTYITVGSGSAGVVEPLQERLTFYAALPRLTASLTLNDPVKGLLDGTNMLLAEQASDITESAYSVQVRRGRSSRLSEDIPPGQAVISLRNHDREWDPSNTASTWYGNIVPGRRMTLSTNGQPFFDGYVEDWNFQESVNGATASAQLFVADALGSLARRQMDEFTPSSQSPGDRITTVLDRSDVAHDARRDIDSGVFPLSTATVSQGTNALAYLQAIARSDFGYLFADRTGVLRFVERTGLFGQTPPALSWTGNRFKYHGLELQYGSETLYNRVVVTRDGGTPQVATDSTSADTYGVRTLSLGGLLMSTDAAALSLAQYLLNTYKEPKLRVASVTVALHAMTDFEVQRLLALDIGSAMYVQTNFNNSPYQVLGAIEGIAHDVTPGRHFVTYSMSDLVLNVYTFTLDAEAAGRLGLGALAF